MLPRGIVRFMKNAIKNAALLAVLIPACYALGSDASTARVLAGLVNAALHVGQKAKLGPHLSVLLGLSPTEASVEVRQLGFKNGDDIKTLNVCGDNHENVVLMTVGSDRRAEAYLMSPDGVLRKALRYQVGGDTTELRLTEAKPGFLRERKLWLERAPALGVTP